MKTRVLVPTLLLAGCSRRSEPAPVPAPEASEDPSEHATDHVGPWIGPQIDVDAGICTKTPVKCCVETLCTPIPATCTANTSANGQLYFPEWRCSGGVTCEDCKSGRDGGPARKGPKP